MKRGTKDLFRDLGWLTRDEAFVNNLEALEEIRLQAQEVVELCEWLKPRVEKRLEGS